MLNWRKLKIMIRNNNSSNNIKLPAAINVNFNSYHHCYQYRLIIYNSKFSKLLFDKKERAKLIQQNGEFYLIKDTSGNLLNPSPKHQTTFMSVGKVFSKSKDYFQLENESKSATIKIKIKLNLREWGLHKLDIFLESKEERDLAEQLMSQDYEVEPITFNDKNKFEHACADIILYHAGNKIPIEITITAPSEREALRGVNSPHGHQWTKVSGRITPLLIYSLEHNLKSFMIINKKWEKYPHVQYLIKKLNAFHCFVLYTDFSVNWGTKIAKEINKLLSPLE